MFRVSISVSDLLHVQDVGGQGGGGDKGARAAGFGYQKDFDHTPHHLFIEMDELEVKYSFKQIINLA